MNYAEKHITELIAKAYYEAAKDGSNDMFIITELLEKLKISLLKTHNKPYEAWNGLLLDRFRFDKENIIHVFVNLKNNYYEKYYAELKTELSKDFNYSTWIREYADSLIFLVGSIFNRLCTDNFPFTDEQKKEVEKFEKMNAYIMDGRWVEAYPIAEELSRNDLLSDVQKSSLQVQVGQIHLYWFPEYMNASKHFENAERLDPGNSFVNNGWGTYYMKMKDYEKSRSYFLLSMEKDKNDVYNFTYTGDSYKEEGKNEIAEQWYRNAINLDFTSYEPYTKLIQLYGNWDAAPEKRDLIPELVQKAEHLFPDTTFENLLYYIYKDTGAAYSDFGDYAAADKYYRKAISLKPAYTMAKIDLAYILAYQDKTDEAESILNEILDKDKDYYDVHWALAWLYEQDDKKREKALSEYEKCIELRPAWADKSYNSTGILYFNAGDSLKAKEFYNKAIEIRDTEPVYYDNLLGVLSEDKNKEEEILLKRFSLTPMDASFANRVGVYYFENDEYQKSLEYYQKAIQLNPENNVYFENLGLAFEELDKLDEAEENYLKALELKQEYPTYNRLGIFYYRRNNTGDQEKAIDYYNNAVSLSPATPVLHENIGLAYEKLENLQKAEEAYKEAADLEKEKGIYFNRLGFFYYTHFGTEKIELAIDYYKKALDRENGVQTYLENLGLAYEVAGKWDDAAKIYEDLLSINEKDHYLRARLVSAQAKMGAHMYPEALENILKCCKDDPENIIYKKYLGELYERMGKNSEAFGVYEELLKIDPDDEYYNNRAGIVNYVLGTEERVLKSIAYYKKATKANPRAGVYYQNIGLAYEKLGNIQEATKAFDQSIKLEPDNAEMYDVYGAFSFRNNEIAKAIEMGEKAIKLNPDSEIYYQSIASAYELLPDLKKAKAAYTRALEINPENAVLQNQFGIFFYKNNELEKAVAQYKKAIELKPSEGIYWQNLGLAYEKNGNIPEAMKAFERSVELAPDNIEMLNLCGEFFYRNKEIAKAIDVEEKVIQLNPNNDIYYQNLAGAYELLPDLQKAQAAYLKAIEINPANHVSQNLFGILLYKNSELEKAIEQYNKAIQLKPSEGIYWQNLGLAYEKLGKMEAAEKAYLESVRVDPENTENLNFLGVFYTLIKDYKKAIDYFQKAIEINPANSLYYTNLGYSYEQLNETELSGKAYTRANELTTSLVKEGNGI